MRQKALLLSLVAVSFAGLSCDSATRPLTTGGISIRLLTPAGVQMSFGANARAEQANATANVTLTSVRVTVAGPTPKTITSNAPSAGNFDLTVTDLDAGSYTVSVEGLVNGEVSNFGQTSSVQVTAGQNTTASVTFLTFRPTIQFPTVVDTSDVLHYTVNFVAVTGATSYIVAWSLNADMSGASTKTVTTTSADIVVTTEGKYFVTVRAVNSIVTAGGMASPAKAVFVFQGVAAVTVTPAAPTIAAGATQQMTAEARDGDNNVVSNVTFFWASDNQAAARVSQTGLVTGASGGVATITAVGKGMPGSTSITVTALPITALVITVQPTSSTAGNALSPAIEVELRDASGNRVTSARNTVTLAIGANPGTGTLSGTKVVNAINGVASFSGTSIDKAGSGYTLIASTGGVTPTPSSTFDITAGPPAKLAFSTQPAVVIEGNSVFTAQVQVTDAFGNVVSTATNPVTLEIGRRAPFGGSARLLGTPTVAAVSGVATFSNLRLDIPGSGYSLNARSGSLQTAGSDDFRVKLTFTQIDAGSAHTCAVTVNNSAYCWGNNGSGQLGLGTFATDSVPRLVTGGLAFARVSAGNNGTCGLTTTDVLFCWGNNSSGQIATGAFSGSFAEPQLIAPPAGLTFKQISAGGDHNCATTVTTATGIAAGGFCWGSGGNGQIGDGGTASVNVVTLVAGGLTFKRINAGDFASCGIDATDLAYCWGYNGEGGLGVNDVAPHPTPTQVNSTVAYGQAEAGQHSCFRKAGLTGDILCAGRNAEGQLGIGNFTNPGPPDETPITSQLSWSALSVGGSTTCMLDNVGAAYCTGRGTNGQLGIGLGSPPLQNKNVRTAVTGGHVFTSITVANSVHTCGVTTTGEAWCWGFQGTGRLGNGAVASINRPDPVQVIQ